MSAHEFTITRWTQYKHACYGMCAPFIIAVCCFSETMTISSPGADDPEVFLLNRDHQKVIKVSS